MSGLCMKRELLVVGLGLLLSAAGCSGPDRPGHGDIVGVLGTGEQATDPPTLDAAGKPLGIELAKARLDSPVDMAFKGDTLFVIDWNGHKIRRLDADGFVYPVVGTGIEGDACESTLIDGACPGLSAEVNHPADITFDAQGALLIAAWHNSKLKLYDFASQSLHDLCGSGLRDYLGDGGPCFGDDGAELVAFDLPSSVAFDSAGNLFIADQANQVIRRRATDGTVSTVCGSCPKGGFGCPLGVGYTGDGGPAKSAQLDNGLGQAALPAGKLAFDPAGNLLFADTYNHVVRKLSPGPDSIIGDGDPNEEIIETIVGRGIAGLAGDGGQARDAELNHPTDLAIAADGTLYIADRGNHCVRRVDAHGIISTFAGKCGEPGSSGDGGPATGALLDEPFGVALAPDGALYIADTLNQRVRKVLP